MVRDYKRKTAEAWTKQDLLEALDCIKNGMFKINDCARHFGISRATLYRHYQKFIRFGGRPDYSEHIRTCGGNPILTRVEEQVMTTTVLDLRAQGFAVTSSDIKRICFEYCDTNGIPTQFRPEKRMASDDWYYGFLKRHPEVRISKPGSCDNENSCEVDGGGGDDDNDKKKGISKVEKGSGASLLKSHDPPLKSKASKKPSGELKKPVKRLKKNTNARNRSQSQEQNTFSKGESLQDVDTLEQLMESGKGTEAMDIEEPKKESSENEEDNCEEVSENDVDSDDMEVSKREASETEQSESDEGEEEDEDYDEESQTQKVDEGEEADNFEDIEEEAVTQELDENMEEDAMDTDDDEIPKLETEEGNDVDDDDCVEEEEENNNECEEESEDEGDEEDDKYSAEEEEVEEEEEEDDE